METTTGRAPTLTKKDVARRVSDLTNEPLYKCEPWVQAVIESIRELMEEADPEVRIELRDFGVFEVKKTKAKPKARNPKTNETVFIPARRKTHFKPSKRLRSRSRSRISAMRSRRAAPTIRRARVAQPSAAILLFSTGPGIRSVPSCIV